MLRDRTREEWDSYAEAVARRHPMLAYKRVAWTMYGIKLHIEVSPQANIQEMFYNGWTTGHYVSNVLVFGMDGTIIYAALNAPGSFHDSKVAERGKVYEKLHNAYLKHGVKGTVDSAFNCTRYENLLKGGKDCTSMRQTAEWGMHGFRVSWPRICDRIPYKECGNRVEFLKLIVLLYNYRANHVGLNQIRNTYMNSFSKAPHQADDYDVNLAEAMRNRDERALRMNRRR